MPASASLIANMKTVIASGPSAGTIILANAVGGPIMDYQGNTGLVLLKLQEASQLLAESGAGTYPTGILTETDSGTDGTNLALLQKVQSALLGLGAPSTTLLADMS